MFYQLFINILSTFYQLFYQLLPTFYQLLSTFYQLFINFYQLFINFLSTFYQLFINFYQLLSIFINFNHFQANFHQLTSLWLTVAPPASSSHCVQPYLVWERPGPTKRFSITNIARLPHSWPTPDEFAQHLCSAYFNVILCWSLHPLVVANSPKAHIQPTITKESGFIQNEGFVGGISAHCAICTLAYRLCSMQAEGNERGQRESHVVFFWLTKGVWKSCGWPSVLTDPQAHTWSFCWLVKISDSSCIVCFTCLLHLLCLGCYGM